MEPPWTEDPPLAVFLATVVRSYCLSFWRPLLSGRTRRILFFDLIRGDWYRQMPDVAQAYLWGLAASVPFAAILSYLLSRWFDTMR